MRKWLPLTAVSLGAFMLLVDVTIVTVALPDMATDMNTGFAGLQWVMDIYALALAALLLGAGSSPTGSAAAASTSAGSPSSPPPPWHAAWPPAPAC